MGDGSRALRNGEKLRCGKRQGMRIRKSRNCFLEQFRLVLCLFAFWRPLEAEGELHKGLYGCAYRDGGGGVHGGGNRWGKKCVCHVHNGVPLFFLR